MSEGGMLGSIGGRSAVNAQLKNVQVGILLHGFDNVAHVVGDPSQRGTGDVPSGCTTGQSHDRSSSVRIPARCVKTGEGG
jgi:hypothetical protein